MDATIMPSMRSLLKRLKTDYPEYRFAEATGFWWSASDNTIHIDPTVDNSAIFSLHELSHAILGHRGYESDIDLVKLERDAWEYARQKLGPAYDIHVDEAVAEGNLDTYRDWLHSRSTCPDCEATGLQTKQRFYRCLACDHRWRVNEARICALRRYSLQTK